MNKDRMEQVGRYIQRRREVSIAELQASPYYRDYSAMTLWRDLKQLEQCGCIRRVHGGVISMQAAAPFAEGEYSKRARENIAAKEAIAREALRFIAPGHSVFLDAGSTLMALANQLGPERYTIITSGANIAIELSQRHNCDVLLTGGQISENTLSCSGALAERFIEGVNIDAAVMAASGFSPGSGFTIGSLPEASLKRLVIERAKTVVMLLDSSKLGRSLPFTFAALSDIDALISEAPLPGEIRAEAARLGVSCIVAEKPR
ncbi:MAG: DeoR/GlpR family DNA-binding transcription regulator [Clostridia bacterium]|nr:DeoR/GlpR family DNA-binding transcription regulator [Clostridia bacterium]